MNLKEVLMQLGNALVLERGFDPANVEFTNLDDAETVLCQSTTEPIKFFTDWLNKTPEAQEILAEMEIDWPVVNRDAGG